MNFVLVGFVVSFVFAGINYIASQNIFTTLFIFFVTILFFVLVVRRQMTKNQLKIHRYHQCYQFINTFIISLNIKGSMNAALESSYETSDESTKEESFEDGLLEYPQYTEPFEFNGEKIPDILYSGNHTAINKWRKKQALKITKECRPELLKDRDFSKEEKKLLDELKSNEIPKWESDAISKGHKFIK